MQTPRMLVFGTGVFLRGFLMDFASRAGFRMTLVSSTSAGDDRVDLLRAANGVVQLYIRGLDESGSVVDAKQTLSVVDTAFKASGDFSDVLATAGDRSISIVSSNVSESGFKLSDNPSDDMTDVPASFPARLERWMFARYSVCPDAELNVLPCELIADNGVRLREMVLSVASRMGRADGFAEWLNTHVAFSDTLVDRICTPSSNEALAAVVEPHTFWALKGPVGPSVDRLADAASGGIVIAPTIENYQLRKVRLLNGLHTAMATIAPIKYGIATVREALEHPDLGAYLEAMLFDELIPSIVPPVSPDEASAYANLTLRRMRNPFIKHQLASINVGAPAKWQTRLLPAITLFEERYDRPPARIVECYALFQSIQVT
ncbi:MAG: hypothetical protein ACKO14_06230 [Armatimonadota bacterium]